MRTTYDALGRVRGVTLPDGKKHRSIYDGHGRVSRVEREGVANVEYGFDGVTGLLATKSFFTHSQYQPANALVRTVAFTYDAIGRVRTESHALAAGGQPKVFTYYYDGATPSSPSAQTTLGLLTAIAGDGFTRTLEYRADGKVTRKVLALGSWRRVESVYTFFESDVVESDTVRVYDSAGALLSTSAQHLGYDTNGRLDSVKLNGALLVTFGYDGNGQLARAFFANGDTLELGYDSLTRIPTGASLTTRSYASSTSRRLGVRGLVELETMTVGSTALSRSYGYSPQRFLTSAADAQSQYEYGFDAVGLPTSVTKGLSVKALVERGDILTAGTVTYGFDGLHRTVSRVDSTAPGAALSLVYGADGQLAAATRGGVTFGYQHDEAGQRLLKLRGETPVAAYLDEGYLDETGLTERFSVAGRTVGLIKNGVFASLATDLRGSVMAETSGEPRIASPFGQRDVHPEQSAAIDYVEKGYDADLGLVRMGVRDYEPDINRFTTADPLFLEAPQKCVERPIECNLYAYAGGDPIGQKDPTGTVIDVVLDVAFVAFDVGSAIYHWSKGDTEALKDDLVALGADALCAVIPGATGGGAVVRGGKKVAQGAEERFAAGGGGTNPSPLAEPKLLPAGPEQKLLPAGTEGPPRFVSQPDGRVVDTHSTPRGSYDQPGVMVENGAARPRTDILQGGDHGAGLSHTHEPIVNTAPDGRRFLGGYDDGRPVSAEDVRNIESGAATRSASMNR